jgi:hypothetical protein
MASHYSTTWGILFHPFDGDLLWTVWQKIHKYHIKRKVSASCNFMFFIFEKYFILVKVSCFMSLIFRL